MASRRGEEVVRAAFPGPDSENESWVRAEFDTILDDWFGWRRERFASDSDRASGRARLSSKFLKERENLSRHLGELLGSLRREIPSYSPRYVGHMVSELSLPALLGHFATLLHNPNNTSREASKVGTEIEREAIAMLARMVGFDPALAQGHFTSGGTIANYEAVWRARYRLDHWMSLGLLLAESGLEPFRLPDAAHLGWPRFVELCRRHGVQDPVLRRHSAVAFNPPDVYRRISAALGEPYLGPVVLVPGNKHYSWRKAANVFGLGEESFWSIALDGEGRLDPKALAARIDEAAKAKRPVLMVVSVAGTTETGEIDPIDEVARLLDDLKERRGWQIWHHVDAAYGGFLCSLLGGPSEEALAPRARRALSAMRHADSITIDPHKLGYVPYACGAFLSRDHATYAVASFDAPYLDRGLPGADKWTATLEGSRAASGAAATWLTGKAIGFTSERMGAVLASTIRAARRIEKAITSSIPMARFLEPSETNIICFSLAKEGETLSSANARTSSVYESIEASDLFWVSKTVLGADYAAQKARHIQKFGGNEDVDGLFLIRCVVMNVYWSDAELACALIPELVGLVQRAVADFEADKPRVQPVPPRHDTALAAH